MATLTVDQAIQEFQAYVKRMKNLHEAAYLVAWDMRTGIPKKGVAQRSEVYGMLAADVFKMSISEEMGNYLKVLAEPNVLETLDPITKKSVLERKKEYDRNHKIPADKYQSFVVLCSNAESAWQEAKANNDFAAFQPYLEQIVATVREFVEIWGYEGHPYNTLLDQYEPGLTVEQLDRIFGPLRERTVALVKAIGEAKQPDLSCLRQEFPVEKQREFCHFVLGQLGYDFAAGRLDESAHPFAIGINPGDVRVTTRFRADDVQSALFGTIHECGHALYEQNVAPDLVGTFLAGGTSMGIHESQSRFWENIVGRSFEFWTRYYPELQARFPEQLGEVPLEVFYKAINAVEPSLIRVDADELTYNLHIMIRYEIEKGLIGGEMQVADLPRIWEEKMSEYLGVKPENDATGVLQDIHWAGGDFGYFPSYSLGNIYAAMFENTIAREIPNYKEQIQKGDFTELRTWLTEKVYKHGKTLTPKEIMMQVTGEEINSDYLVKYLEEKYKYIYGI
jgi:carboxypeptidase Taq